jgi:hypothetical protein
MRHLTPGWLTAAAFTSISLIAQAQTPPTPVPKPFPGATPPAPREKPPTSPPPAPTTTTTTTTSATTNAAPAAPSALDPLLAGIAIYPAAELLESYDAGQGQRYFIFGTAASFLDVVTYYRTALKNGGRELFKTPGMQQFDLGRYQEQSMAYPPSVVVKDYVWNGSTGYLHVTGRTEKRYPTIIQIVPR